MSYETLTVTLHEHIATVTLNRPDKANAMSLPMWQEIRKAFDDAVHPGELEIAVARLPTGPGGFADADHGDARLFHQRHVIRPDGFGPLFGVVVAAVKDVGLGEGEFLPLKSFRSIM